MGKTSFPQKGKEVGTYSNVHIDEGRQNRGGDGDDDRRSRHIILGGHEIFLAATTTTTMAHDDDESKRRKSSGKSVLEAINLDDDDNNDNADALVDLTTEEEEEVEFVGGGGAAAATPAAAVASVPHGLFTLLRNKPSYEQMNARRQEKRGVLDVPPIIDLVDSDDDDDESCSSEGGNDNNKPKVVIDLVSDDDDEVEWLEPPAGYVAPPARAMMMNNNSNKNSQPAAAPAPDQVASAHPQLHPPLLSTQPAKNAAAAAAEARPDAISSSVADKQAGDGPIGQKIVHRMPADHISSAGTGETTTEQKQGNAEDDIEQKEARERAYWESILASRQKNVLPAPERAPPSNNMPAPPHRPPQQQQPQPHRRRRTAQEILNASLYNNNNNHKNNNNTRPTTCGHYDRGSAVAAADRGSSNSKTALVSILKRSASVPSYNNDKTTKLSTSVDLDRSRRMSAPAPTSKQHPITMERRAVSAGQLVHGTMSVTAVATSRKRPPPNHHNDTTTKDRTNNDHCSEPHLKKKSYDPPPPQRGTVAANSGKLPRLDARPPIPPKQTEAIVRQIQMDRSTKSQRVDSTNHPVVAAAPVRPTTTGTPVDRRDLQQQQRAVRIPPPPPPPNPPAKSHVGPPAPAGVGQPPKPPIPPHTAVVEPNVHQVHQQQQVGPLNHRTTHGLTSMHQQHRPSKRPLDQSTSTRLPEGQKPQPHQQERRAVPPRQQQQQQQPVLTRNATFPPLEHPEPKNRPEPTSVRNRVDESDEAKSTDDTLQRPSLQQQQPRGIGMAVKPRSDAAKMFGEPNHHLLVDPLVDQPSPRFVDPPTPTMGRPVQPSPTQPATRQFPVQASRIMNPLDTAPGQGRVPPEQAEQWNRGNVQQQSTTTTTTTTHLHSLGNPQDPTHRTLNGLTAPVCLEDQPVPRKRSHVTPEPLVEQPASTSMSTHLSDGPARMKNNAGEALQELPRDNFVEDDCMIAFDSDDDDVVPDELIQSSQAGLPSFHRYFDDDPLLEDKTYPGAIYSACHAEFEADDPDLPCCLEPIEHLSEYSIDPKTFLPVWTFFVHGGGGDYRDDGVLYKFKAFAAQSNIPGAQLGAFISFLGAYTLSDKQKDRNTELRELVVENPDLKNATIEAIMSDGMRARVTITGNDLFEDYELQPFIPIPPEPIKAKIPPGAPAVFEKISYNVVIVGDRIHEDPYRKHTKRLERKCLDTGLKPLGSLKTNVFTDYTLQPSIKQCKLPNNCIDLGLYGPFLRSQLKPEDVFATKSFIFQKNPGEWGFGVEDKLHDQSLIVDITDDTTGQPNLAKCYIPMYVNEVGYSNVHRQNVYAYSVDGNTIHYFFWPGQDRMSINEPIELYTNYRSGFEDIRERRGYGIRNAMNGLPSDAVAVARLERSFSDREDATNYFHLAAEEDAKEKTSTLARQLDFLRYEWSLLYPKNGTVRPEQIVALRRISWLANVLGEIVDSPVQVEPCLAVDIKAWVASVVSCESELYRNVLQSAANETIEVLKSEIIEEVLYLVRRKMPLVMDTNLYCPIARNLIEDLCIQHCEMKSTGRALLKAFVQSGLDAMEEIRKCAAGSDRSGLTFVSRETEGTVLCGTSKEILGKVSRTDAFYVQHTTFSKGILTAVAEVKCEAELLSDAPPAFVERLIGHQTLMAKWHGNDVHQIMDAQIAALCSIPVDAGTALPKCEVNVDWYTYWQVVWIVHSFAQQFVPNYYDLTWLCRELGVELLPAQFVAERGVRHYSTISFDDVLRTATNGTTSRRARRRQQQPPPSPTKTERKEKKERKEKTEKKPRVLEKERKEKTEKKEKKPRLSISSTNSWRPSAKLKYEGSPIGTYPVEGEDWPAGWTQRTYERASGASKGHEDHYWFPPDGRKLRSHKEILRYLAKLH